MNETPSERSSADASVDSRWAAAILAGIVGGVALGLCAAHHRWGYTLSRTPMTRPATPRRRYALNGDNRELRLRRHHARLSPLPHDVMKKLPRGIADLLWAVAIWWAAAFLIGAVFHFAVQEVLRRGPQGHKTGKPATPIQALRERAPLSRRLLPTGESAVIL